MEVAHPIQIQEATHGLVFYVALCFTAVLAVHALWRLVVFLVRMRAAEIPPSEAFQFERPVRRAGPKRAGCPRCRKWNLQSANFCGDCGLMLQSHTQVRNWMYEQRQMLDSARQLGAAAAGGSPPKPKSSPAPPPRKDLPATAAPPPKGR
jgi:hypothetical protein